jgi:hypothetical protein
VSFDDQIRQALDRALTGARTHLESDMRALAQDIVRAAAEERTTAVAEAAEAAAADVRRHAQTQLAQLRDSAQKHGEELRRTAEIQITELKRLLDESHRAAEQRLAKVQNESQAEVDRIRRDAHAALAESQRTLETRVAELRQEIDRVKKAAAAEAEETVVAQLAAAASNTERRQAAAVERARTDAQQTALAQAARFADAIRSLDEARTLGDVLETLAECAGREVDRSAVLLVKGERLQGWRLAGFGAAAPTARSIDVSFDEAGLPGAVVRTGISVSRPAVEPGQSAERQPALPPFAHDAGARHAIALPVTVGGAVVAVLYGDAPRLDRPSDSSRWPAMLDVLARHASRVLEAMTVQQAAGLSLPRPVARGTHGTVPGPLEQAGSGGDEDAARRYARLLLSEIRMYNEPLVDAGRRSRDLLSRLGGEIQRARQLYEARVPSTVTQRGDVFDQELVRTLADGDRNLLGSVQ